MNTSHEDTNRNNAYESTIEDALAKLNLAVGVTMGYEERRGERVFQLNEDRFRHTFVLGRTGSGKSNHVQQMEREDIQNGAGCFILAAHEDDALYALASVPEYRLDDVVLIDAANPEFLPRMNPLDAGRSCPTTMNHAMESVLELLRLDNFNQFAGPRFESMVRNGLKLIMASHNVEDRCIANLSRVYSDPEYVKHLLRYCTDERVYSHWAKVVPAEMSSNDSGELIHWFVSKLSRFETDTTLAHFFGPGQSTIYVNDIVDTGKILVAYVPEDRIGSIAARVITKFLMMQLRDAIMNRSARVDGWRGLNYNMLECGQGRTNLEPFFVYVDEFSKFASKDFESLLAEARKQRTGFVLSTQTLSQTHVYDVETDTMGRLEDAVLGNVGSFICYPMGARDVEVMSRQLGISPKCLLEIKRYRPLAQLCTDNNVGAPLTLTVGLRPNPDNPSAPRRIARAMVDHGIWLPVASAANKGEFRRMIAGPEERVRPHEGDGLTVVSLNPSHKKAASSSHMETSEDLLLLDDHPYLSLDTELFTDETFDFSVRTFRCLSGVGITTLGKLLEMSEDDLSDLKGITPRCVREIKRKLARFGLSLRDES